MPGWVSESGSLEPQLITFIPEGGVCPPGTFSRPPHLET